MFRHTVQIWRWKSTICAAAAAECQTPVHHEAPSIELLCNMEILSSTSYDETKVLNEEAHRLNVICMLIILATKYT